MKIALPKLLTGLVLLLWGWQVDLLILSILMAIVIESSFFVKWRIELANKDLNRISDLCTVLYVALLVYAISTSSGAEIIEILLRWLPVIFYPIVLIQKYSNWTQIPITVLSLRARRQNNNYKTVDMSYLYFFACAISASSSMSLGRLYYGLMTILIMVAFYRLKGKRFHSIVFVVAAASSIVLGFVVYLSLIHAQSAVENYSEELFRDWFSQSKDPFRRSTALGSMGRVKDSNSIILRVDFDSESSNERLLLKEGSYDHYSSGTWYAKNNDMDYINKLDPKSWQLKGHKDKLDDENTVSIILNLDDGEGLLPSPLGSSSVSGIYGGNLERSSLGTLKIQNAPEFVRYDIKYNQDTEVGFKPSGDDLVIPKIYESTLAEIIKGMNVADDKPETIIAAVDGYFENNYSYTLDLDVINSSVPSVIDFLKNTHAGHCEYFATSTVLLLRQAGIPARYIYGYSVQEYSYLEGLYVVRDRHAHAWAVAYVNGHWINVDTTPPDWSIIEAQNTSVFTSIYNFFSWLNNKYSIWRTTDSGGYSGIDLIWVVLPLVLYLSWRIRKRAKRVPVKSSSKEQRDTNNIKDSFTRQFFGWLEKQGVEKLLSETLKQWVFRMGESKRIEHAELLNEIVAIYYRYRFDPLPISDEEKSRLDDCIKTLVAD